MRVLKKLIALVILPFFCFTKVGAVPPHILQWQKNASVILKDSPNKENIKTIFFEVLNYIHENKWSGACHPTSSVLFVLFSEIGLSPIICTGNAKIGTALFDHSWVEIENDIYDVAIYAGMTTLSSAPVLKSYDVNTKNITKVLYGVDTDIDEFHPVTKGVFERTVVQYMNDCSSKSPHDLWKLVRTIGSKIGLSLNTDTLKVKYKDVKRVLK